MKPLDGGLEDLGDRSHMPSGEKAYCLGVAALKQQIKIFDRHLFVLFTVHQQQRGAGLVQPSLRFERESRHDLDQLLECLLAEEIGARFDQVEEIRRRSEEHTSELQSPVHL